MTKLNKLTECSVQGCGGIARTLGLCNPHYQRQHRHGSPFGGGTSRGEPLRWLRETALTCTDSGCLRWPYSTGSDGAGQVHIEGRLRSVARIVCEAVNGQAPTPRHEAAHLCGKGHESCVNPLHLAWKTHSENLADKLIHGTHNRGERNSLSKLTASEVSEIKSLKGKVSQGKLAGRFKVSQSAISAIHTERSWSWCQTETRSA